MEKLTQLENQLRLLKQDIIHRGLKTLPKDYIDLKKEVDQYKEELKKQGLFSPKKTETEASKASSASSTLLNLK